MVTKFKEPPYPVELQGKEEMFALKEEVASLKEKVAGLERDVGGLEFIMKNQDQLQCRTNNQLLV